jgi:hypothetical protein
MPLFDASKGPPKVFKGIDTEKDRSLQAEEGEECPDEQIVMENVRCGRAYGADAVYHYEGVNGWWFREQVQELDTPDARCSEDGIKVRKGSVEGPVVRDEIINFNGPPPRVAPCTHRTRQIVEAGPTRDTIGECTYQHEQLIEVTQERKRERGAEKSGSEEASGEEEGAYERRGKVITTVTDLDGPNEASIECDWSG